MSAKPLRALIHLPPWVHRERAAACRDRLGRSVFFVLRSRAKNSCGYLHLLPPTALPASVTPRKKQVLPSNDYFRPFTLSKSPRWDGDDGREIAESWRRDDCILNKGIGITVLYQLLTILSPPSGAGLTSRGGEIGDRLLPELSAFRFNTSLVLSGGKMRSMPLVELPLLPIW